MGGPGVQRKFRMCGDNSKPQFCQGPSTEETECNIVSCDKVNSCVAELNDWQVNGPRDVIKASRVYRKCELKSKNMERLNGVTRIVKLENGQMSVKFQLLKRFKSLEIPNDFEDCSKYNKRKQVLACVAANIKLFLKHKEESHDYIFEIL